MNWYIIFKNVNIYQNLMVLILKFTINGMSFVFTHTQENLENLHSIAS